MSTDEQALMFMSSVLHLSSESRCSAHMDCFILKLQATIFSLTLGIDQSTRCDVPDNIKQSNNNNNNNNYYYYYYY